MIRRPPRSTLFPYRRSSDLWKRLVIPINNCSVVARIDFEAFADQDHANIWRRQWLTTVTARSEEHTSELQSRQYLVCRLLLEKKKTIKPNTKKTQNTQIHGE